MPGNVTVRWFREGAPVKEVAALETRVTIRKDGTLIVNPVSADDSGWYTCEVTNGIGDAQSAAAFLNVECKFPNYFRLFSINSYTFFSLYRSCQSDLYTNNTIFTISLSWCCTMLHQSKSTTTICYMDKR